MIFIAMLTGAEVNAISPVNVSTTLAGLIVVCFNCNKFLRDTVAALATVAKGLFFSLRNEDLITSIVCLRQIRITFSLLGGAARWVGC